MATKLLHNVQVARFVAAASVLTTHTADLLLPSDSTIFAFPWTFGVDIFFVISGFIMMYLAHDRFGEPGAAGDFLLRRLIRIVPPYWIFTTLMLATALLFDAQVRNTEAAPAQIATSYVFLPWPRGDGQLNPLLSQGWTLNYELFFYLCFSAALLVRRGFTVLAVSFAALSAVHAWIPQELFMLRFWTAPIILEFVAGMLLARAFLRGWRISAPAALALAAAGIVLALAPDIRELGRVFNMGVPALLICAALILLPEPERIGWSGRALRAGGDASYALYLSHTFTINAVVLLWRKVGLGAPWLGVAVGMVTAIAAAVLFYRVVERPMTNALQRLAGARPVRGAATVAP